MGKINVKVLILAGGGGTRLWPYSTERLPKQFLTLKNHESTFVQAVKRALVVSNKEDVFISSNEANFLHIKRQLRNTEIDPSHILVKDANYDTGLSIFFSLKKIKELFGAKDEDVVAVLPSDHFIEPLGEFKKAVQDAAAAASENFLVALGKKPLTPQESFGYMLLGNKKQGEKFYRVRQFIEKPPRKLAEKLIQKGCLWNLGIYVFSIGFMFGEFCNYFGVQNPDDVQKESGLFKKAFSLSFDRMIAEKTKRIVALPAEFDWLDMGSWKAFHEVSAKDEKKNVNLEGHILVNTEKTLIMGRGKPIVAIHLENMFVIDHKDALLIVPENRVDALKEAIPILREKHPHLVKGTPFVSICTILSDKRRHTEVTTKSILKQTYPLIEHLILDFGEPEESVEFGQKIKTIKAELNTGDEKVVDVILRPDERKKTYEALNEALQETTGEIIGILNAGDTYEDEGVIQDMVEAMERESADVCWGDLIYARGNELRRITRFWQSSPYGKGIFRQGWMPPHPTFFVRRWVYEKYGGFRTDLPVSAGYEFMLRVLEKEGVKGCYVPRVMVRTREDGGSGWRRIVNFIEGNIESYKSWKLNGLKVRPWFIFTKPFSKLNQLFAKSRSVNLQ